MLASAGPFNGGSWWPLALPYCSFGLLLAVASATCASPVPLAGHLTKPFTGHELANGPER